MSDGRCRGFREEGAAVVQVGDDDKTLDEHLVHPPSERGADPPDVVQGDLQVWATEWPFVVEGQ